VIAPWISYTVDIPAGTTYTSPATATRSWLRPSAWHDTRTELPTRTDTHVFGTAGTSTRPAE
jgi:hypothetical protein